MKPGDNWICPYCGHAQTITEDRYSYKVNNIFVKNWEKGCPIQSSEAIVCANNNCKKLSLNFTLGKCIDQDQYPILRNVVQHWNLLPSSSAKPFPNFIPESLRNDYEEACAIRDLSPKASATLTRRCIQGIIRDFCDIKKGSLNNQIIELKKRVDANDAPKGVQPDTVDAIDHVRQIGNIGAHMEKDINIIVDVEPDEAQTLIELTELLFDEWYIARQKRKNKIEKLGFIANNKQEAKKKPQKKVSEPFS